MRTGPYWRLRFDVGAQCRGRAEKWMERKGSGDDVGNGDGQIGLEPVEKLWFSGIWIDLDNYVRYKIEGLITAMCRGLPL